MIHIIAGQDAARNLEAAFLLDENLRGEIVILQDNLGIGPLQTEEEIDHDVMRTNFWMQLSKHHTDHQLQDEQAIKQLIEKAVAEEEPVCFWMAPCISDVCAYYWLLPFFRSQPDMLHIIHIIGLPFLNEKGQLFYPKHFGEVIPSEFCKTKRLLKKVTPAEYEVDGDEWKRLQSDDSWVRWYEGGKKISSKEITQYDTLIKSLLSTAAQKASKIVQDAAKKSTQAISPLFIEWRLRTLIVLFFHKAILKKPFVNLK